MMKKILFVCKHNRFRSKVAEAIFKKLNKNKKIKTKSAATEPDYLPVSENVQKALQEIKVKRVNKYPKKLTEQMIKWADLIVLVADNVVLEDTGKKVIKWNISDVGQEDYSGILRRDKIIEKRIKNLISVL